MRAKRKLPPKPKGGKGKPLKKSPYPEENNFSLPQKERDLANEKLGKGRVPWKPSNPWEIFLPPKIRKGAL